MKKLLFLIPAIVALMGCSSDSNGMKQKFLILLMMAFGLVACALDGEPETKWKLEILFRQRQQSPELLQGQTNELQPTDRTPMESAIMDDFI